MTLNSGKITELLPHAIAFLSAFLGFWLQLMVAKSMLPEAGGLPIIWIVSVLVFQTLVLIGYIYGTCLKKLSLLTTKNISLLVHGLLLGFTCLVMLPLNKPIWFNYYDSSPILGVLASLTYAIGLLFALLSSNSLLMTDFVEMKCENQANKTRKVYAIFKTSNAGSLLGLMSYPLIIEPSTSLEKQYEVWSLLYYGILTMILILGICSRHGINLENQQILKGRKIFNFKNNQILTALKILGLAAASSFIFLAATTYFSITLFPMPLLWMLPLAAYLIAWINAFTPNDHKTTGNQKRTIYAASLLVINAIPLPIFILLPINVAVIYMICLGLHSRVYELKDSIEGNFGPSIYYIVIAVGGILGNALSLLLVNKYDTSWVFILGCLLSITLLPAHKLLNHTVGSVRKIETDGPKGSIHGPTQQRLVQLSYKYVMTILIVVCYWGLLESVRNTGKSNAENIKVSKIMETQNTMGRLIVEEQLTTGPKKPIVRRTMSLNGILQGDEIIGETNLTYGYTTLKRALRTHLLDDSRSPKRWMALGLGVGTVACAGDNGDTIKIAEINPEVVVAAKNYFSYISKSPCKIEIVLADGRKSLEKEGRESIDILICDAYSGGTIPLHMMTKEFFDLAKTKVRPKGIIAVHISHATLNLKPILASIGKKLELDTWVSKSINKEAKGSAQSEWVLFTKKGTLNHNQLKKLKELGFSKIEISKENVENYIWTDDFSSVLRAIDTPFSEEVIIKTEF